MVLQRTGFIFFACRQTKRRFLTCAFSLLTPKNQSGLFSATLFHREKSRVRTFIRRPVLCCSDFPHLRFSKRGCPILFSKKFKVSNSRPNLRRGGSLFLRPLPKTRCCETRVFYREPRCCWGRIPTRTK